jgi:hypothetical protein
MLLIRLGVLPTSLAVTRAGLLATGKAVGIFLAKMALVEVAITGARVAWQLFTDASGDLKGIGESSQNGLDRLIDKLNDVGTAADVARTKLKAQGVIGGIQGGIEAIENVAIGLDDSKLGRAYKGLTGTNLFTKNTRERQNSPLAQRQIDNQERDTARWSSAISSNADSNALSSFISNVIMVRNNPHSI